MNGYSWAWLTWFCVFIGTFLVLEINALVSGHPENTLSENIWRLMRVVPGQPIWAWNVIHLLLGGLIVLVLGWLIVHLVLGIWA